MRASVVLLMCWLSLFAGCAPVAGPVTVEALLFDPGAQDGARLGDVTLRTVTDLGTGAGELFDVRGGLRMAGLTVQQSVDANDSRQQMVERCRGDGGNTFRPRMTFDGERWLAQDLETLTAFTLFADLEAAYERASKAGDERGSAPGALVGITSEVVAADLFPLPLLTSDNAAYAPPLDGWLTLRVGAQQGVPFAMSLPVLAHEFGHRLFFLNVFVSDDAFAVWRTRTDEGAGARQQRANRIMQGFDEGLADLFSLSVTGDVDGIPRAFRQAGGAFKAEGARRHLEGEFADVASYDGLDGQTIDASFLEACGSDGEDHLFSQATFNFYCLGTVLARALWDGSERDIDVLRDETLPAVIESYADIGRHLEDDAGFDAEFLLEPLLTHVTPARRTAMCDAFAVKFTSVVDAGRVPSCL